MGDGKACRVERGRSSSGLARCQGLCGYEQNWRALLEGPSAAANAAANGKGVSCLPSAVRGKKMGGRCSAPRGGGSAGGGCPRPPHLPPRCAARKNVALHGRGARPRVVVRCSSGRRVGWQAALLLRSKRRRCEPTAAAAASVSGCSRGRPVAMCQALVRVPHALHHSPIPQQHVRACYAPSTRSAGGLLILCHALRCKKGVAAAAAAARASASARGLQEAVNTPPRLICSCHGHCSLRCCLPSGHALPVLLQGASRVAGQQHPLCPPPHARPPAQKPHGPARVINDQGAVCRGRSKGCHAAARANGVNGWPQGMPLWRRPQARADEAHAR